MGNPNHFKLKNAPGGYYKDEVISALQKAIRRSDERRAVYWATVLELEGEKIANQMWHRMLIMANEDIGSADSSVIVKVKTLYDCWKEGLADERLCVIHAALILARAPKSRTCCNLAVYLYDQKARPEIAMPDYAFDRHRLAATRGGSGSTSLRTPPSWFSRTWRRSRPVTRTTRRRLRACYGLAGSRLKHRKRSWRSLRLRTKTSSNFSNVPKPIFGASVSH
jgi:hypothetical protein